MPMRKYYCGIKRTWKIRCLFYLWETIDNLSWWIFNRYDEPFVNICREEFEDNMKKKKK